MIPARALALLLMTCLPAGAQQAASPAEIRQFRPLPFHEIAAAVSDRYDGRFLAAEMQPPSPAERDLGAALVYQFRLATPQRNLLDIRVDARTGRFLSVTGRGQLAARKPVGQTGQRK